MKDDHSDKKSYILIDFPINPFSSKADIEAAIKELESMDQSLPEVRSSIRRYRE